MAGAISDTQPSPVVLDKLNKIEILSSDHVFWGILEQLDSVGSGLIRAKISGVERLIDEELFPQLSTLMGQPVAVCHVAGRWGAGRPPT